MPSTTLPQFTRFLSLSKGALSAVPVRRPLGGRRLPATLRTF
ncbi:hypothetical protein [Microbacterium pumilum]